MAILLILGLVVFLVIAAVVNGWALSILWGWFVVPSLGAKPLSTVAAIGIAMTAGMLVRSSSSGSAKDKSWTEILAPAILTPVIMVCMGWIVRQFM